MDEPLFRSLDGDTKTPVISINDLSTMTGASKKFYQSYMSEMTENAVIDAVIESLYFCSV